MTSAIHNRACFDSPLPPRFLARRRCGLSSAVFVNNPPTTTLEDVQLLQRIAQRDRAAFSQLYDRYSGILYGTALRILNSPEETSDVLQEVFVQIWEKAHVYDSRLGKPFSWLLTLTRHKAIDRLRTLRRRYNFIDEVTQEMAAQESNFGNDEVFGHEKASIIRSAVETLPLDQRQAIEMAFLGGMTQNEISEALRQPLGTIKARIRRGMLKLRDCLKEVL